MPRSAPILIAALVLAILGARPTPAAHAASLAQSHPPAAPAQATATDTPTPDPALTPTPAWIFEVTLPAPAEGTVVRIERRWSYGEMGITLALVAVGALLALRWVFDWVRAEMARPVDPRAD